MGPLAEQIVSADGCTQDAYGGMGQGLPAAHDTGCDVLIPGAAGELDVLPGNAPLATPLADGTVRITDKQGDSHRLAVRGGFAFVDHESVRIFVDAFERPPQRTGNDTFGPGF